VAERMGWTVEDTGEMHRHADLDLTPAATAAARVAWEDGRLTGPRDPEDPWGVEPWEKLTGGQRAELVASMLPIVAVAAPLIVTALIRTVCDRLHQHAASIDSDDDTSDLYDAEDWLDLAAEIVRGES
jgi:hypothetical protein